MNLLKKVRAGGVNEHFNLPWIKLSESKNHNLPFQVEWKSFAGGTGVLTSALHNGEIDIAVLLTEGLILDILKNKKSKLVCFHVNNPLRWAIHIRENEKDLSLAGKKFAISRIGSGSHTMARFLINENNLKYDSSKMIEVGSLEGGLESLKSKKTDVFLWEKFTTEPFLKEFGLKCIGEVKTPWPPFSVAVSNEFYLKEEHLLNAVLEEIRKLALLIKSDPSNAIREIQERWKITPENATQWLSEIEWNDQPPVTSVKLASVLDNMKKAGLLESELSPELTEICT